RPRLRPEREFRLSGGEKPMRALYVVILLSGLCVAAAPALADAPRDEVLKLNNLTGTAPMEGMLQELKEQPDKAKDFVKTGLGLLKDKKLSYNAALVLARVADEIKDLKASETLFRA